MTRAPWPTAYLMPSAMAPGRPRVSAGREFSGSLYSSVTRTDRIRAAGAMPTMPSWSPGPCPCPAMTPATAVPSTPQ